MDWQITYKKWKSFTGMDAVLKKQIDEMTDNELREECFYKHLEFGTGGMRGIIGVGTNRMNMYTVRKAAKGLALYIDENGEQAKNRGVVIAYDSRHQSREFAFEAAKTLGYHGIQVYVFESLRTTPELSFAVRYLHAFSGIVITASHNPSAYNGFKVYGEDGAQFASEAADVIVAKVNEVEDELAIPISEETVLQEKGLLSIIGDTVDAAYIRKLDTIVENPEVIHEMAADLKIVYTPLHGTGSIPVQKGLHAVGFKHVHLVKEQAQPDGDFPTVVYPNPEEEAAFSLAMEYGEKHDADILLATDPDADRVGVAVKVEGIYQLLTGNQIGALLLHYLITEKQKKQTLSDTATFIKTIVTSELGREIATKAGVKTMDTLTGFKYISAKIKAFETDPNQSFLIGFEESYGYLIGDFVRDKDAVQTCLVIAEVAAFYKKRDKTLVDALQDIYQEYGYFKEGLESLTLAGRDGMEKIATILTDFRANPPSEIAGKKVLVREDYQTSERIDVATNRVETIELPVSNVLKYKLADGAWVCVRPSGTEPKIKFYFGVKEATEIESDHVLTALKSAIMEKANNI